MLYDAKNHKLSSHKKLNNIERQKSAQEDFEHWFNSATDFLEAFRFDLERGKFKQAVFLLHQATERYYHAIILVFTGYKTKTHDLKELGRQSKNLNPEFDRVFPKATKEEKRLFELLQKAYVDARYKRKYTIEKNELEYLGQKVEILKEMTERICTEKIKGFVG